MISYGKHTITNPKELFIEKRLEGFRSAYEKGSDRFLMPDYIDTLNFPYMNRSVKHRTYKIGFLYEAIKHLHPKMNSVDLFMIIFDKYQCHFNLRVLQSAITLWNKNRHIYLKNVLD